MAMRGQVTKRSGKNSSTPDLIFVNANIITLDPYRPRAEMAVIGGGKVLFVGNTRDLKELRHGRSKVIDCHGKTLLPGFNDAHCHFIGFAESLVYCTFGPKELHFISDIQDRIRKFAQHLPPGTWIKARAYDEFYLDEKRHPTRRDLDIATSTHPVKLAHRSGHAHVLNSLAMKIARISAKTPEPPGAIIQRDPSTGEPNGVLFGMGPYLSKIVPSMNDSDQNRGVKQAGQQLLSLGITSIQDVSSQNDIHRWHLFQKWKSSGHLKCRLSMMLGFDGFKSYRQQEFSHPLPMDELRISGVKIVINETTSELYPPQSKLNEIVFEIHQAGLQVAVHAIEERTIEAACSAIEYALRKLPRSDHRHRIEHCSVCTPSLSKRLASLGIMVVTNPSFIYFNGDRYLKTVPDEQLKHLYPIATLIKNGVKVAAGSDCPVVPVNPLIGICSAICRMTEAGKAVLPPEGITPFEALRMYGDYAARTTFEEAMKGSITTGKFADLVILSEDPTKLPPNEIKDIEVKMTILNGKVVWDNMS